MKKNQASVGRSSVEVCLNLVVLSGDDSFVNETTLRISLTDPPTLRVFLTGEIVKQCFVPRSSDNKPTFYNERGI